MADTPWIGTTDKKLYLQSGQFTSTLKTSEYIGGVDSASRGISYDGTNTPWCGYGDQKLYLQSGQFTSTIKTSQYIGDIDTWPVGISWDSVNTPWSGEQAAKLYLQSGHFTSTIKDSEAVGSVDVYPYDISYDGTNTPWIGQETDKLYLQSGQFTSTIKTSQYVGGIDNSPTGISYDGVNTPWCGYQTGGQKLYLQSGQFTSTLKTSEDVSGIDLLPTGICTNDIAGRLGGGEEIFVSASDTVVINDTAGFIAAYVVAASDTLSLNDEAKQVHEIRVTREYADVLGAGEGKVRATRQYIEMLTSGYPKARVARQYVEVLTSLSDAAVRVTRQCVAILADKPIPFSEDAITLIDEAVGRLAINLTYYGTFEEAGEYFETRLYEWAWSAASSRDKERALIEARCLIDGLCYKGYKHTVYEVMKQWAEGTKIDDDKLAEIRSAEKTQWNEFPRGADVEIPEDILIAQYEIAHSLLDNKDPQLELELLAVTSATYGGVKTMYQREQLPLEHLINLIPNALAWRQLRPYLRDDDAIKLSRVS